MSKTILYDSHCHVFNGSIIQDMIHIPPILPDVLHLSQKDTMLKSWSDYVKETTNSFVDSEVENNDFLSKTTLKHFPNATACATVPLMMDVHYLFADDMKAGQPALDGEYSVANLQNQIDDLRYLSAKGNCYPFFAVDTRRAGVVESIIDGEHVTKTAGRFFGVKMYPRLGYHPMAGALPAMYEYCAKKNIPIMTHCSGGGFPTWSSPSDQFCNPENFRPALEANPTLRITFAHFGNGKPNWAYSIIDLMSKFPNVYSDLSCHTSMTNLNNFKKAYWNNDIVKQRTLYGSDYNIFYLTETGTDLDDYVNNFQKAFTPSELNNMMTVLPERFLF